MEYFDTSSISLVLGKYTKISKMKNRIDTIRVTMDLILLNTGQGVNDLTNVIGIKRSTIDI